MWTCSRRSLSRDLQSVHEGQHHVEDDDVEGAALRGPQAGGAVVAHRDGVALVLEVPADVLRDVPIVFHQQDSHRATHPGTIAPKAESTLKAAGFQAAFSSTCDLLTMTRRILFWAHLGIRRHDRADAGVRRSGWRARRRRSRSPRRRAFKPPTFADDTLMYVFGPAYRNPFITSPAQPDGADISRNAGRVQARRRLEVRPQRRRDHHQEIERRRTGRRRGHGSPGALLDLPLGHRHQPGRGPADRGHRPASGHRHPGRDEPGDQELRLRPRGANAVLRPEPPVPCRVRVPERRAPPPQGMEPQRPSGE